MGQGAVTKETRSLDGIIMTTFAPLYQFKIHQKIVRFSGGGGQSMSNTVIFHSYPTTVGLTGLIVGNVHLGIIHYIDKPIIHIYCP